VLRVVVRESVPRATGRGDHPPGGAPPLLQPVARAGGGAGRVRAYRDDGHQCLPGPDDPRLRQPAPRSTHGPRLQRDLLDHGLRRRRDAGRGGRGPAGAHPQQRAGRGRPGVGGARQSARHQERHHHRHGGDELRRRSHRGRATPDLFPVRGSPLPPDPAGDRGQRHRLRRREHRPGRGRAPLRRPAQRGRGPRPAAKAGRGPR
jgi:hypothetical protein